MKEDALFIVIEGLDGSGKTSVARQLAYFFSAYKKGSVKLSYEPHDASSGGLFIRQILEKKIKEFSPETLMLAFAANRLDHGNRVVNKWLNKAGDRMVLCDRYYLSSLVYQSNETISFEEVMEVNRYARQPDLTFFMNVRNETCYHRMKVRNKPQELFESNLSETRDKYFKAIDFLRSTRNENIVLIDANGTMEEVMETMIQHIVTFAPKWKNEQAAVKIQVPPTFSLNENRAAFAAKLTEDLQAQASTKESLQLAIEQAFSKLSFNDLGALFFDYLEGLGYQLKGRISGTTLDAYALEHQLPGGILQKGMALVINEAQRYDGIWGSIAALEEMADFIFVLMPEESEVVTTHYERDLVNYADKSSLSPAVKFITKSHLQLRHGRKISCTVRQLDEN